MAPVGFLVPWGVAEEVGELSGEGGGDGHQMISLGLKGSSSEPVLGVAVP